MKLSEMLAGLHGRYKWLGTWPAIPHALRRDEPDPRRAPLQQRLLTVTAQPDGTIKRAEVTIEVPPDVPPKWVENIYERLFEKILPPQKGMTVECYDAAIFGYTYAAISRERAARLATIKSLPPDSKDRRAHEEVAKLYKPTLEACRRRVDEVLADWKLPEAADYLEGYAYGITCQHREEGWTPSAKTETLQNYKAMVHYQEAIQDLIRQKKTAREIGQYIAERAMMRDGKTSLARCMGNNEDAWADYLSNFQKLCARIELPLPHRGRPAKIRTREE